MPDKRCECGGELRAETLTEAGRFVARLLVACAKCGRVYVNRDHPPARSKDDVGADIPGGGAA